MALTRWLRRIWRKAASTHPREGTDPPSPAPPAPESPDAIVPEPHDAYVLVPEPPDTFAFVREPQDAIPPDAFPARAVRLFPAATPFGRAVRAALGPALLDEKVLDLLMHCAGAAKGHPTAGRLRETAHLLAEAPAAPPALTGVLWAAGTVPVPDGVGPLLGAVAWSACVSRDPDAITALGTALCRRSRPSRHQPRWVRTGLDALTTTAGDSGGPLPGPRGADAVPHEIRTLAAALLEQYRAGRAAPPEDRVGVKPAP
ncbi:hypothetical protein [Streptomyces sp. H39-S7]|uniref:hypothetical protein n=1 Tax=Streptomyces sp. H39-S7 TaxID=3004357 RepID=UPI0022AFA3A4|nr:hypothetical protein [Streptomyces sp. H39-S7]MCZ4123726.1 hypothetical protein [Streptomyces sp. H39-S7]